MRNAARFLCLTLAISALFAATPSQAAENAWRVEKSGGEVWIASAGARTVALSSDFELKAGDQIRTGKNGRALLVRGQEAIFSHPIPPSRCRRNQKMGWPLPSSSKRDRSCLRWKDVELRTLRS